MKTKTGISLVLTLLMIVSTFTTVNALQFQENKQYLYQKGSIDFTKSVWDPNSEMWVDYIEDVPIGTTVRFNISLTYHKDPQSPNDWTLHEIVISDSLPECLEYADNVYFYNSPEIEEEIEGNIITWDFTGSGHFLQDGETMSIEFDATVVENEETENENIATVNASECYHYDHSAEDSAWVYVLPPLEFKKEVYDPETGQWVDVLDGVKKNVPVDFKITITYLGYDDIDLMKCMVVNDYLPDCCLEYVPGSEIITYPNEENFEPPNIIVSENLKDITYDWTNKKFNLYAGETITIQFKANVVNYCYESVDNCAEVYLWSCIGCPSLIYGSDCATVNCYPPEPTFNKWVKDTETGNWVEETFQYVGETVTFKIELVYYGNYNLTDVRIVDYLPYVTEYAGNANIEPTDVSGDGKTIWWNLTDPVEDGVPLIITFDALVTGSTGDCPYCGTNQATVTAVESESQEVFEAEDTAKITSDYYDDPKLSYIPNNINFGEQEQGWTGSSTFVIWNSGQQTLTYTISSEGLDWISVTPTSGSSTGEQDTITVSVLDTSGMSGYYSGNIVILSNDGDGIVFVAIYIQKTPEIELTITIPKKIFIGNVCAVITNTGEKDVSVEWSINATAGILKKNYGANGLIETLGINLAEQVSTGKSIGRTAIKLKFGKITGTVTAIAEDYTTGITFSGLILGRLIIITKWQQIPEGE